MTFTANLIGQSSPFPCIPMEEVKLSPIGIHVFHAFYQIFSYPKDMFVNFWDSYIKTLQRECLGHTNLILISFLGHILQNQKIIFLCVTQMGFKPATFESLSNYTIATGTSSRWRPKQMFIKFNLSWWSIIMTLYIMLYSEASFYYGVFLIKKD